MLCCKLLKSGWIFILILKFPLDGLPPYRGQAALCASLTLRAIPTAAKSSGGTPKLDRSEGRGLTKCNPPL